MMSSSIEVSKSEIGMPNSSEINAIVLLNMARKCLKVQAIGQRISGRIGGMIDI